MMFGAVLRKMRKEAGFSQELLAEKLHMSRSNVSRLEGDKIELKVVDLVKWCRVTNNPDIMMGFIYGVDALNTIQPAMQLITGTIFFLGGLL